VVHEQIIQKLLLVKRFRSQTGQRPVLADSEDSNTMQNIIVSDSLKADKELEQLIKEKGVNRVSNRQSTNLHQTLDLSKNAQDLSKNAQDQSKNAQDLSKNISQNTNPSFLNLSQERMQKPIMMTQISDAMDTLALGHQVRRSKSILNRREHHISKVSLPDATEYYKHYQDKNNHNSSKTFNLDLIGDSYIGISKLL